MGENWMVSDEKCPLEKKLFLQQFIHEMPIQALTQDSDMISIVEDSGVGEATVAGNCVTTTSKREDDEFAFFYNDSQEFLDQSFSYLQ